MKPFIIMRRTAAFSKLALLGAASLIMGAAGAQAATDIFLKIPGIVGTVTDRNHENEIAITGFSANASRQTAFNFGGGAAAGRVNCGQVTLVKQIDQTSPKFLGLLFGGARTASALLSFEKRTGGEGPHIDYYKIELLDVLVTSISQTDPQDGIVTESIVLQASQYRYSYTPQNPDGTAGTPVTFGWDCRAGRQL